MYVGISYQKVRRHSSDAEEMEPNANCRLGGLLGAAYGIVLIVTEPGPRETTAATNAGAIAGIIGEIAGTAIGAALLFGLFAAARNWMASR
jgi:hypothetical protein